MLLTLPDANCLRVTFELGIDDKSYAKMQESRLRDPKFFVYVGSVAVETERVAVGGTNGLIDLRKSSTYRLPEQTAKRILDAAPRVSTPTFDCHSLAAGLLGVEDYLDFDDYLKGWSITQDNIEPSELFGEGLLKSAILMRPHFGEEIGPPDPEQDHWFVPITETDCGQILHVRGSAGPLMLSDFETVRDIYPGKSLNRVVPRK